MTQLNVVIAILLGIFQGVVEWLPISSTGQTILAMIYVMEMDADVARAFSFYLHFGTLLAVLLKMRKDVKHIVVRLPKFREDKLARFMIISTLATAIVGIPVYIFLFSIFEGGAGGDVISAIIGTLLIITGLALYFSGKKVGTRNLSESNTKDSFLAGIAQGFSVLPGISRSGVTVAALIGRKMDQKEALRLSFLMSIPAIAGIIVLEGLTGSFHRIGWLPLVAGITAAFIVGYFIIEVLLRFARNVRFHWFCIVFGMIAIAYSALLLL